jgi:hypothetical protein
MGMAARLLEQNFSLLHVPGEDVQNAVDVQEENRLVHHRKITVNQVYLSTVLRSEFRKTFREFPAIDIDDLLDVLRITVASRPRSIVEGAIVEVIDGSLEFRG